METYAGGARGSSAEIQTEFDLVAIIQIHHLYSALVNYLKGYGEEFSEKKIQAIVADMFVCHVTGYHDKTHYWLSKSYIDGSLFVDYLEKEIKETLNVELTLWREYDPQSFYIYIETNSNVVIGFRKMFKGISKTVMSPINEQDIVLLNKMVPLMEHSYIVDFSLTQNLELGLFQPVGSIGISWGYLVEEVIRIGRIVGRILDERRCYEYIVDMNFKGSEILPYLDIPELRTRYENSSMFDRILTIGSTWDTERAFNSTTENFAIIIAQILNVNFNTIVTINQQIDSYTRMLGRQGLVNYCTHVEWMGRALIIKLGMFENV